MCHSLGAIVKFDLAPPDLDIADRKTGKRIVARRLGHLLVDQIGNVVPIVGQTNQTHARSDQLDLLDHNSRHCNRRKLGIYPQRIEADQFLTGLAFCAFAHRHTAKCCRQRIGVDADRFDAHIAMQGLPQFGKEHRLQQWRNGEETKNADDHHENRKTLAPQPCAGVMDKGSGAGSRINLGKHGKHLSGGLLSNLPCSRQDCRRACDSR